MVVGKLRAPIFIKKLVFIAKKLYSVEYFRAELSPKCQLKAEEELGRL